MAENTRELLEFLSYKQLKAIWAEYRVQNPQLPKTFSNSRAYIINISRLFDDEEFEYDHFTIEECDNGEFTFRFPKKDSEKLINSEDEKLAKLVETKASIAHPPESKEKKEDSKNVYSDKPPETISTKLLSFTHASAVQSVAMPIQQVRSSYDPPSSPRGEAIDAEFVNPSFSQTAEAQEESTRVPFTKFESVSFNTADVEAAGVYFDPKAKASEHLTRFPWILFNTKEIPVLSSHRKLLAVPPKLSNLQPQPSPVKEVKKGSTYTTTEENWSFEHVLDDAWEEYFYDLYKQFKKNGQEGEVMTEYTISSIVEQFCVGFGHSQLAQYDLRQYPTFNLLNERQEQVTVKPDLSAGYFKLTTDHKTKLLVGSTPETQSLSAIKEMLDTVLSWKLWDPRVSSVVLPCLVAEFKKDRENYEDVSKLLIEMAMIRDTRARLFAEQTCYTLGVYVCEKEWRFYALRDYVPPTGQVGPSIFKYEAFLLDKFTLEHNLLSWFQLGVIMWRLAAYNLSRLLKCKVKDKTQLNKIREELQEHIVQITVARANSTKKLKEKQRKKDNKEDCKPKEDKKGKDDDTDNDGSDKEPKKSAGIKRSLEQPRVVQRTSKSSKGGSRSHSGESGEKKRTLSDWLHMDVQSKVYSNSRTTVNICTVNGKEMVLKINHSGNGTHEVYMLRKLQGPGVVKLYHADRAPDHTRIFLERLYPLPEFANYNDLCHFMRGLFAALVWIHENNVVHGDIKPQNVMISKKNEVKIIDFGYSIELHYKQRARYIYGNTYVYKAPELLLNEPQTNKIDIFAAGLVCAEKMLGIQIESFDSRCDLIDKVFDGQMSHLATESGIDLLQSMLSSDPEERPTAEACLDHPFLSGEYESIDESF